jgi:hypothetical protein
MYPVQGRNGCCLRQPSFPLPPEDGSLHEGNYMSNALNPLGFTVAAKDLGNDWTATAHFARLQAAATPPMSRSEEQCRWSLVYGYFFC